MPEPLRDLVARDYAAALRRALEERFPGRPVTVEASPGRWSSVHLTDPAELAAVRSAVADLQDDEVFWATALGQRG